MEKFDPVKFFEEMQGILKQFKGELMKEVDGKLENFKKEMNPPSAPAPPEFPPLPPVEQIGLIKREIFKVEWTAKMLRKLTEEEIQVLSKELFDLMQKYGLDLLDAKKIKE